MSKKAIDKEYLLNQLQNFESNILDPKYLDESDIEPLSTADIEAIKTKFNPTTYVVVPEVSPTTSGLMTPADKIKLNNISNNANNVLFDQELNDGALIGTLIIDGVDNNLYAPASLSESDIAEMGFTKNTGTVTGITMNGASKTVTGGVVDLGTVITEHQDISGKVDKNGTDSLMTADEHTKLAGIATGAEVNVQSDYAQTNTAADDYIKNKPTLGTAASKDVASSGNASTTQVVMGNDTRLTDARNAADVSAWAKASTKPTYTAIEVGAIPTTAKGAASGVAELDSSGKVPSSQLPSYVDDVLEYTAKASFPATGETGKIYVDTTTNLTYRWSGTAYVEISPSLALGETSSTAYRGDRGKAAYDHASAKGSAFSSGLYKITTNAEGHVTAASAVVKSDITGLGIPGSLLPSGGTKDQILVKQSNTNDDADWETVEALSAADIAAIKAKFEPTYSSLPTATIGAAGLMSAADKAKLDGIEAGAEENTVNSVKIGTTTYEPSDGVISLPNYPIDTDTHRSIQVEGTEILGNNTTPLNLEAGDNISITNSSGTVTIEATDTTYESKTASSGGTDLSLVTTGEKYDWNSKPTTLNVRNGILNNTRLMKNSVGWTGVNFFNVEDIEWGVDINGDSSANKARVEISLLREQVDTYVLDSYIDLYGNTADLAKVDIRYKGSVSDTPITILDNTKIPFSRFAVGKKLTIWLEFSGHGSETLTKEKIEALKLMVYADNPYFTYNYEPYQKTVKEQLEDLTPEPLSASDIEDIKAKFDPDIIVDPLPKFTSGTPRRIGYTTINGIEHPVYELYWSYNAYDESAPIWQMYDSEYHYVESYDIPAGGYGRMAIFDSTIYDFRIIDMHGCRTDNDTAECMSLYNPYVNAVVWTSKGDIYVDVHNNSSTETVSPGNYDIWIKFASLEYEEE